MTMDEAGVHLQLQNKGLKSLTGQMDDSINDDNRLFLTSESHQSPKLLPSEHTNLALTYEDGLLLEGACHEDSLTNSINRVEIESQEKEEENNSSLATPLLQVAYHRDSSNEWTPPFWKWKIPKSVRDTQVRIGKYLLLFLACFLFGYFGTLLQKHSCEPSSTPLPDSIVRANRVVTCAAKLSPQSDVSDENSPQGRAVDWFVLESGKGLEAPENDEDCRWGTVFSDFYALIVLGEAMNVTQWLNTKPVTGLKDACNWNRLSCDDKKSQITKLHLHDAYLSGTIPHEIAGLLSLEQLELYGNKGLAGTLPPDIGQLSHLEALSIHKTTIEGTIPPTFGNLFKLEQLMVDHTNLTGSMPLGVCKLRDGDLQLLHADCDHISCNCCDNCYSMN